MTNHPDINFTRLTLRQMRKVLQDNAWIKDEDATLARFLGASAIYRHSDGRILEEHPSVGGIYASEHDLNTILEWHRQSRTQKPQHILRVDGRFPYGEDFPAHVGALVDQLADLLKIPRLELDYSWASLEKVEKKVKHRGRQKSLSLPVFPALLAYVGEVMRNDVNGEWQMRRSRQEPDVLEPWIVDSREHQYNPFLPLYDALDEDSDYPVIQIVIAATAEVAFDKHHLPPHKKKLGPIPIAGDDSPPEEQ